MERAEAEAIFEEGREVVVAVLLRMDEQIARVENRVAQQDERIVRLERQVMRSSRNSSQPVRTAVSARISTGTGREYGAQHGGADGPRRARGRLVVAVATPSSRRSTLFCTPTTRTCVTMPKSRPNSTRPAPVAVCDGSLASPEQRERAAHQRQERSAEPGDVEPWVAANALMGVHRALVEYTQRRVIEEGARQPRLARDVRAQADQALTPLGHGLARYALKERRP